MKTIILKPENGAAEAARLIKAGQVVGIPTETVYGLGANALDRNAVLKIFAAKGRPADNPLIVHIADFRQLSDLVTNIPDKAKKLADAFWPGPLTMIFGCQETVPRETTGGLDTVAIRLPSHPTAKKIIQLAGCPIAAPSANISGRPSPTSADHVFEDMDGKIPLIVDGGECHVGVESTVISMVCDPPLLLRPGGITPEQIESVIGPIAIDPSVTGNVQVEKASSPGMKYKHYSPKAAVTLLHGDSRKYITFVNTSAEDGAIALCFDEEAPFLDIPFITLGKSAGYEDQAHLLFSALRRADKTGAKKVYAHCPAKEGVGLAVFNRLVRAAGFDERWL